MINSKECIYITHKMTSARRRKRYDCFYGRRVWVGDSKRMFQTIRDFAGYVKEICDRYSKVKQEDKWLSERYIEAARSGISV